MSLHFSIRFIRIMRAWLWFMVEWPTSINVDWWSQQRKSAVGNGSKMRGSGNEGGSSIVYYRILYRSIGSICTGASTEKPLASVAAAKKRETNVKRDFVAEGSNFATSTKFCIAQALVQCQIEKGRCPNACFPRTRNKIEQNKCLQSLTKNFSLVTLVSVQTFSDWLGCASCRPF